MLLFLSRTTKKSRIKSVRELLKWPCQNKTTTLAVVFLFRFTMVPRVRRLNFNKHHSFTHLRTIFPKSFLRYIRDAIRRQWMQCRVKYLQFHNPVLTDCQANACFYWAILKLSDHGLDSRILVTMGTQHINCRRATYNQGQHNQYKIPAQPCIPTKHANV